MRQSGWVAWPWRKRRIAVAKSVRVPGAGLLGGGPALLRRSGCGRRRRRGVLGIGTGGLERRRRQLAEAARGLARGLFHGRRGELGELLRERAPPLQGVDGTGLGRIGRISGRRGLG